MGGIPAPLRSALVSIILEGIPEIVLLHDGSGIILYVNEIGAQRLGWHASDLIGKRLSELVS
jgi:PAS domain S-box-containing protein